MKIRAEEIIDKCIVMATKGRNLYKWMREKDSQTKEKPLVGYEEHS